MSLMDRLKRLYQVDAQVRGLRSRLESAERYLTAQQRLLGDVQQRHDELATRKKQTLATIANLEMEVKAIDERLEKLRDDMNNAATTKQYDAVLTELNTNKTNRNDIDERTIADMELIETLDGEIAELDDQLTERKKLEKAAKKELSERKKDVGDRLTELEQEREEATDDIPASVLAIFDEMAYVHEGEAMTPLEEVDRRNREYACGACNMHVPFERLSLLMIGGDDVVRCSACQRILYIQDELRGALTKK